MKKVITFGVFDLFHYGHLRLFKNIKKIAGGDAYLIVAVQNDDFIKKFKPDAQILYTTQERLEILSEIKSVDEVVTYNQVDDVIGKIDFDVLAKGCEQGGKNHIPFMNLEKFCKDNGKEILIIPRTEGISSTYYKRILEEDLQKEKQ